MIALASQLGDFLGVFTAVAAIVFSIRRHAVAGVVFAFLRLCHSVSSVAQVATQAPDSPE
jgi:hypothetical protein